MRFGDTPLDQAEGALLAHSVRVAGRMLKKGHKLTVEDIAALRRAGHASVVAARLEPGDIHEDQAARAAAEALGGDNTRMGRVFTGRCNLFATARGLALIDGDSLDAFNLIDESITVATVPAFQPVEEGDMLATVKVIPFAAPEAAVAGAVETARRANAAPIRVAPFTAKRAAVILTELPHVKEAIYHQTAQAIETRLARLGCALVATPRVPHDTTAIARAIAALKGEDIDLLILAGASAIVDRRDVIPAAITASGGEIVQFGMPVDPGNLMLVARLNGVPVIGAPGCARSPKLNGFDWVLQRLAAGLDVTARNVRMMGVGGLLKEVGERPLSRTVASPDDDAQAPRRTRAAPHVAALVLAAGRSSRMGAANKLTERLAGKPIVAHVIDAALEAHVGTVIAVTGHDAEAVRAAIDGRPIPIVHNRHYAEGLSSSLKRGLKALPKDADAVLVLLGDMPGVTAEHINRLIEAFDPVEGRAIVVATHKGKRGNPVLWDKRFIPEMMALEGDTGARALIRAHADLAAEVEMRDDAVLIDIDTPEELTKARTQRRPAT